MMFKDKEEIIEYTGDDQYQIDSEKPGLCFGVSIESVDGVSYELYYHFMDQEERAFENQPN